MRLALRIAAIVCLLYGRSASGASLDVGSTGDHVRVIVDTSKSMCGAACGWQDPPNDPGRLSILSTLLLHDLLKPDPNKAEHPDSFAVIPFGQEKWLGGAPPPSQATPRRANGMAGRAAFLAQLGAARMPFDAMNTYYSPSIERALNDLPPLTPEGSEATTRTIVLITDGRSVLPDEDSAYIEDTLLPRLAAMQARLYVIMFGPDARQYGEPFFQAIERADAANVQSGRYPQRAFPSPAFIVDTGRELPETMIRVFSEGFGYLHVPADDRKDRFGTATVPLNLHRDAAPTEAAIVALKLDPVGLSGPPPPRLELLPPPGAGVNPQPMRIASEPGGAYALRWELTPSPGEYRLRIPNGSDESVFVLRPTNLTVDLRAHRAPGAAAGQTDPDSCFAPDSFITMADRQCKLDFVVGSAAGTQGIPPALNLKYWIKQPKPGGAGFWNSNDEDGVGIGAQDHWDDPDPAAGGRRYWTLAQFKPNQIEDERTKPYRAHITVNVDLQRKTVAFRDAADPFLVTVYPRLRIAPDPSGGATLKDPASGALQGGGQACTVFYLDEDLGTRIESASGGTAGSGFNVRAFLIAAPRTIAGELRDAKATLDGESIGFRSASSQQGDDWSKSKPRTLESLVRRNELGGSHELCVTLGPYADGDPSAPPELQVQLILDHPPYDRLDVIESFKVKVLVAKAPPLSWWSLLPFLLLAAGLLLALLLLRARSTLPKDLHYAISSVADPQGFVSKPLPAAHPLRLLFSRRAERQIEGARGEPLGWVRPEDEALYSLRPAPGVTIAAADGTPMTPERSGAYLLGVHRPYRLANGEDSLLLRIQFA